MHKILLVISFWVCLVSLPTDQLVSLLQERDRGRCPTPPHLGRELSMCSSTVLGKKMDMVTNCNYQESMGCNIREDGMDAKETTRMMMGVQQTIL